MSELQKLIESIDLRFTSGNSVPVTRAMVRAEEWQAIRQAITEQQSKEPQP